MNLVIEHATPQQITIRLREGEVETSVTGWHTPSAVSALLAAVDAVTAGEGYAECFWPEPAHGSSADCWFWWKSRSPSNASHSRI